MVKQDEVTRTFDDFSDEYTSSINDSIAFSGLTVDFFTAAKAQDLLEFSTRRLGDLADLRILDVGCGIGIYQSYLEGRFAEIHGVDVSAKSVTLAQQRNPFALYKSFDGGRLPYDDGYFDISFAICVMHHVPPHDWPQFVDEMARVTKPTGLVLVYEHNPLNPITRYIVSRSPIDADATLLGRRDIRKLFERGGFDDVRIKSILSLPPSNALLRIIDRALNTLPFGTQYRLSATPSAARA